MFFTSFCICIFCLNHSFACWILHTVTASIHCLNFLLFPYPFFSQFVVDQLVSLLHLLFAFLLFCLQPLAFKSLSSVPKCHQLLLLCPSPGCRLLQGAILFQHCILCSVNRSYDPLDKLSNQFQQNFVVFCVLIIHFIRNSSRSI